MPMNNYPQWWNETLTIYNKFVDKQTQVVRWYRTAVNNCFWKYTGNKVTIDKTVLETNAVVCRIPQNPDFIEKHQWINIPNDQMNNYFTLAEGDIIIKGEVYDAVNEYTPGTRSSDLIEKYKGLQGCMVINRITINVGGGRNNPHYYVLGE